MTGGIDWQALAVELERAAARSGARGAELLRRRAPALHDELLRVRAEPWPLALWGTSRNHDENADLRIVAPGPLRTIAHLTRTELPLGACHSGLLHTYGYLFSTIDTPYGRKRDRWVRPALARGLGLPDLLRPTPDDGTLLHNVTWLLARIAWRDDPRALRRLARRRAAVAEAIVGHDYARLEVTRITQRVHLEDRRLVELHTELVPFAGAPRRGPHGLLVYWCRTTAAGRRLLTAFPVTATASRALLADARAGRLDEARPRYNAAIEGFDAPRPARCTVATGTA